jgi:hypothetical protein
MSVRARRNRNVAYFALVVSIWNCGSVAIAKPAIDGLEKISKKESFSSQDTDALVIFHFDRNSSAPVLPDFIWAKIYSDESRLEPYKKKSIGGIDVTSALFAGSVLSGRKKGKGKYFAFRIPAGRHAICEAYFSKADMPGYETRSFMFSAPLFDFVPGKINFIGDLSTSRKSIVTLSDNTEGDSSILIQDTSVMYIAVAGLGVEEKRIAKIQSVRSFVNKKYRNVDAEIVVNPLSYIDLTQPASTPTGFVEVAQPNDIEADSEEFLEHKARRHRFEPVCLPKN